MSAWATNSIRRGPNHCPVEAWRSCNQRRTISPGRTKKRLFKFTGSAHGRSRTLIPQMIHERSDRTRRSKAKHAPLARGELRVASVDAQSMESFPLSEGGCRPPVTACQRADVRAGYRLAQGQQIPVRSSERKQPMQTPVFAAWLALIVLVPLSEGVSRQQPPDAGSPLWHFEAGG